MQALKTLVIQTRTILAFCNKITSKKTLDVKNQCFRYAITRNCTCFDIHISDGYYITNQYRYKVDINDKVLWHIINAMRPFLAYDLSVKVIILGNTIWSLNNRPMQLYGDET